ADVVHVYLGGRAHWDMLHRRLERDGIGFSHDRCPEIGKVGWADRRRAELVGRLSRLRLHQRHTATASAVRGRRAPIISRSASTTICSSPGCMVCVLITILFGWAVGPVGSKRNTRGSCSSSASTSSCELTADSGANTSSTRGTGCSRPSCR